MVVKNSIYDACSQKMRPKGTDPSKTLIFPDACSHQGLLFNFFISILHFNAQSFSFGFSFLLHKVQVGEQLFKKNVCKEQNDSLTMVELSLARYLFLLNWIYFIPSGKCFNVDIF